MKRRVKPEPTAPEPTGPNPAASRPLHVAPFGRAWAVVEGLGVYFASVDRAEAEAELARLQAKYHQLPSTPPPPDDPSPAAGDCHRP